MASDDNFLVSSVNELNSTMKRLCDDNSGLCDRHFLSVLQLNVQRVSNIDKFHNIITLVNSMAIKPDVLIFTETWITRGTESVYQIPGYESFHCCRDTQSAGIAVYYKPELQCEIMDQSCDEVSYIHAKLYDSFQPDNYQIVTAFYMPDSTNFPILNAKLDCFLTNDQRSHLIMGDFNVNLLRKNAMTDTYKDTIETRGYTIKNTLPTRPSSGSLIDHVISNFDNTLCITFETDLSDHNGTIVIYENAISVPKTNGYSVISSLKTDFDGVKSDMSLIDLENLDAKSAFSYFHESLRESISRNTLTSVMKVKNNNPHATSWIDEELIKLSKRKHRLLTKKRNGVVSNSLDARIAEVTSKVADLKKKLRDKDKQSKFGPHVNSKTRWNNLNKLLGRSMKTNVISKLVKQNGDTVTNKKLIPEEFNKHFTSVSSPIISRQRQSNSSSTPSIFLNPATSDEVSSVIKNLKNKKSVGWDNVSTALLKAGEPVLAPMLALLMNKCLSEGYYPDELKIARVVPVFKKGSPCDVNNYRPISILPIINKVFEKLIYVRLLNHLKRLNYLSNCQYGFTAKCSTKNCAIDLLETVYDGIDMSYIVTVLFLDLSKAFDLVNHLLLLSELEQCGVRGLANDLFSSYLTNRKQYVTVSGNSSSSIRVLKGVPQGSVLGPLLFLIYINSIAGLPIRGKLYLFADDTAVVYSSPSAFSNCAMASTDLTSFQDFYNSRGLCLNAEKTKTMHFRTQRNNSEDLIAAVVNLNGKNIETVTSFKYLGVYLDSHLTWNVHIDFVAEKIRPIISIMFRAKTLMPCDVRKLIYFSMIHPHLSYIVELWGAAATIHWKRIQIMQNLALRNLLNLPPLTPRVELYTRPDLNILPVKGIYELSVALLVYRRMRNLTSGRIMFERSDHSYESRNRLQLRKVKCKLGISQRRLTYMGPSIYNELPPECKNTLNPLKFRKQCHEFYRRRLQIHLNY